MVDDIRFAGLEVGYDVPALPGMSYEDIQTPCLILDLDALERNIRKMATTRRRTTCATGRTARCTSLSMS